MTDETRIRAFQHLSFEAMKNGAKKPMISSEVCVGETNETILEGSLPLEEALDNLIKYKSRSSTDAVTTDDREILLSQVDAILEIVKSTRSKILGLPNYPTKQGLTKKLKP
ncbi:hypothetical protein [Burkholderia cenocepacia]|uniref:hypothetical protein n=1 Tax=Burkholderia cenocepacia TaxID=95486 RepID=UPI00158B2E01|nr:hypothetical protein [Burkholderia cenocepacia]